MMHPLSKQAGILPTQCGYMTSYTVGQDNCKKRLIFSDLGVFLARDPPMHDPEPFVDVLAGEA
jgi:hypothetical protein